MRTNKVEVPLSQGTSFPPLTLDGRQFYRTDLGLPFWYDETRGKWLGFLEADGAGAVTQAGAGYLRRFAGAPMSGGVGIFLPYSVTIVGFAYSMTAAVTGAFELRRSGVALTSIDHSASANRSDMTLDVDFTASGVLSVMNTAGTVNNVQVRIWWRRLET